MQGFHCKLRTIYKLESYKVCITMDADKVWENSKKKPELIKIC